MGNSVDHHSDMRLDIEDMSYEASGLHLIVFSYLGTANFELVEFSLILIPLGI